MYIMNSEAAVWWREQGITQFTAPWELTKRELSAVTDGRDMQWICYGRIPLMVSAQCIFRNIKACLKNSGKAMAKVFAGEKGRRYIVRNCCKYCYNIIYREEPFQIPCSMEREFWEKVHQVRFEFTTETAEEVHAVLKDEIIRDHCRGHFDVRDSVGNTVIKGRPVSADSRSAQKWKGMVIGMDKKEAAQKLMSIFGNVDAIAVLHSVLVGISKYIIIVVFAVYTWHCFTVFIGKKHGAQRGNIQTTEKDHVYDTFYLFVSIIFEQSVDKNCSFLCGTGRFLVLVDKAYSYVYQTCPS